MESSIPEGSQAWVVYSLLIVIVIVLVMVTAIVIVIITVMVVEFQTPVQTV